MLDGKVRTFDVAVAHGGNVEHPRAGFSGL